MTEMTKQNEQKISEAVEQESNQLKVTSNPEQQITATDIAMQACEFAATLQLARLVTTLQ